MEPKKYIIEIATSDFVTTKSAVEGGADRIELCANLAEGGTTPSLGTIRQCRKEFDDALRISCGELKGFNCQWEIELYRPICKDFFVGK